MLKFAFVSDAAEREYRDLPGDVQDEFGKDLRRIQYGEEPRLPIQNLGGIAPGVIELKKNGSPAFRCVYVAKFMDTVFVLHSFAKTTNGVDRPAMQVVQQRLKDLKAELRAMGYSV
jgi:phage-related protein